MTIIINASNLYVGGGVQVALSFINELKTINLENNYNYHIFVSQVVDRQLNKDEFNDNFKFYTISKSPAALLSRRKVVDRLNELENNISPNIVFTVFGPSYWRPKSKHLIGFADGWVYNPKSVAYKEIGFFRRIKMKLYSFYKSHYLKKDADYYVLETEDAKTKFSDIIGINAKNVYVVGNTYSSVFNESKYLDENNEFYISLPNKQEDEFRLMYIAHNHPNKNLKIIDEVVPYLKNNIKFVLTIGDESYRKLFNNSKNIINLGPIEQKSCPSVYKQCDALFAPTLLETFSASYPEAMKMGIPILTSEYSFAKDICKNSAIYFNPLDPKDIAEKILMFVDNKSLQLELIQKGKKIVNTFETASSRAEKYVTLCENIVKYNKIKGNV